MSGTVKESLHQSFSIIAFVLWFFIALYHTISYLKFNKERVPSIYLSFLLLFLAFIDLLSLAIETYDPIQTKTFCLIIQHGGTISYALFKCMTYLTLIMRLYECFKESILGYNIKHLLCLSGFLITWTVANIIIGLLLMDSTVNLQTIPVCVISFPWFLPASWALADLIAIICCSYLFTKPIFRLREQMRLRTGNSENALHLKYVAQKQCILSSIACITTIFALMIMGAFNIAPLAIGVDVNVSIICVILMYKWNKYIIFFCCAHCKDRQHQKNLQVTTSKDVEAQEHVPSNTSITNTPSKGSSKNSIETV